MLSVCIVIPAYNAAAFIASALDSVAAQSRRPDQIIVVDDGSEDDTAARITAWAEGSGLEVELLRQRNRGAAAARNAGLAKARTDLVALLDADDLLMPESLSLLASAFERHEIIVVCFGDAEVFNESGIIQHSFLKGKSIEALPFEETGTGLRLLGEGLFDSLLAGSYISSSGTMLSVAALRKAGGYDEALQTAEDRALWLRMTRFGCFGYYPRIMSRIRRHQSSLSTTTPPLILARNGLAALGKLKVPSNDDDRSVELGDRLVVAARKTAKQFLYHASTKGLQGYLAERRRARDLSPVPLPMRPRDLARALYYSMLRGR